MQNINIRNYQQSDADQIVTLQKTYAARYPQVPVRGGDVYNYPDFEGGQNIFCAFDQTGVLLGYAPIFPKFAADETAPDLMNTLWLTIMVDPTLGRDTQSAVRQELLTHATSRAQTLRIRRPHQQFHLAASYSATEEAAIEHILSSGFTYDSSIFDMIRAVEKPFPELTLPDEIVIRCWKITTQEEQLHYLKADNIAFPHAPKNLQHLQYFLASPYWQEGTAISAFDEAGEVVASIWVYWHPEALAHPQQKVGFTEEIFVLPEWRGRGLAKYLIREGCTYLKDNGLTHALLQVMTNNQNALQLYLSLGYVIAKEEKVFALLL